eukprot:1183787-Prorocentrum_minimum.AAC.2
MRQYEAAARSFRLAVKLAPHNADYRVGLSAAERAARQNADPKVRSCGIVYILARGGLYSQEEDCTLKRRAVLSRGRLYSQEEDCTLKRRTVLSRGGLYSQEEDCTLKRRTVLSRGGLYSH